MIDQACSGAVPVNVLRMDRDHSKSGLKDVRDVFDSTLESNHRTGRLQNAPIRAGCDVPQLLNIRVAVTVRLSHRRARSNSLEFDVRMVEQFLSGLSDNSTHALELTA
jgi:hypothetical protein